MRVKCEEKQTQVFFFSFTLPHLENSHALPNPPLKNPPCQGRRESCEEKRVVEFMTLNNFKLLLSKENKGISVFESEKRLLEKMKANRKNDLLNESETESFLQQLLETTNDEVKD